jgi:hypothetical protein
MLHLTLVWFGLWCATQEMWQNLWCVKNDYLQALNGINVEINSMADVLFLRMSARGIRTSFSSYCTVFDRVAYLLLVST